MKEHLKLLGFKVTDAITGFTGVISSISFDISGCVQGYVVPSADKEGKLRDGNWYDLKRLRAIGKAPTIPQPDFINVPGGQNLPAPNSGPGR